MLVIFAIVAICGCNSHSAHPTTAPAAPRVEGTITDRVTMLISSQMNIPAHNVEPASRLRDDLGFDELDQVELVMNLEDAFHIALDDATAASFQTVGDAIRAVARQTRKGRLTNDGIPIRPPSTG